MNLLLFGVAEEENHTFHWLDIRRPGEVASELDPARMGWVDRRRLWTVDPFDASAPDNPRSKAALFELVREDEPPAMLARLAEFLRLPEPMQQILSEVPAAGFPGVLAVANAQRTNGAFPETTLAPILEAIAWAGYSLFVGYVGPAPAARSRFARVLRVDGDDPVHWQDARIALERGASLGPLAAGPPLRLIDVPFAARTLERATHQA